MDVRPADGAGSTRGHRRRRGRGPVIALVGVAALVAGLLVTARPALAWNQSNCPSWAWNSNDIHCYIAYDGPNSETAAGDWAVMHVVYDPSTGHDRAWGNAYLAGGYEGFVYINDRGEYRQGYPAEPGQVTQPVSWADGPSDYDFVELDVENSHGLIEVLKTRAF